MTEIARAPESELIFLEAKGDTSGIRVPAHLREQMLHELMMPSTLIRLVDFILESGLAARWMKRGTAQIVGFQNERRAWTRSAAVDVGSVKAFPVGLPA